MKVYKVAGPLRVRAGSRRAIPFDTQRFSIDLQPKRGDAPFIVQPPPLELRDQQVATDGWDPKAQYVGYDEDFVPMVDAYTHEPSVVPFYKASFVWLMKRQTTDYYLRVVVPLGVHPDRRLPVDLHSAVALRGDRDDPGDGAAVGGGALSVAAQARLRHGDVSDRIFVFIYMLVSLMIGCRSCGSTAHRRPQMADRLPRLPPRRRDPDHGRGDGVLCLGSRPWPWMKHTRISPILWLIRAPLAATRSSYGPAYAYCGDWWHGF